MMNRIDPNWTPVILILAILVGDAACTVVVTGDPRCIVVKCVRVLDPVQTPAAK